MMRLRHLETCSAQCAAALREDRAHGLIYGPYYLDGYGYVNSYHYAAAAKTCTYCGASLPKHRGRRILARLSEADPFRGGRPAHALRLAIVQYW